MLEKLNYIIDKYIVSNLLFLYIIFKDLNIKINDLTLGNTIYMYIFFKFVKFDKNLQKFIKLLSLFVLLTYFIVISNILKVHNFNDAEEVVGICLIFTFFSLILILNEYISRLYLSDYVAKYNKIMLLDYISFFYELDCEILRSKYLKMLNLMNDLLNFKQFYYNFVISLKNKWKKRKTFLLLYFKNKLISKYLESIIHNSMYKKLILKKFLILFRLFILIGKR